MNQRRRLGNRLKMKRPATSAGLLGIFADRTGPHGGSDTIDFQRFNFLVAFLVAVGLELRLHLQVRTISNQTGQRYHPGLELIHSFPHGLTGRVEKQGCSGHMLNSS